MTGGAFAYNQFTNDSEATLEPGALVNQDNDSGQMTPRFRTGNQTVSVIADTDMTMVNAVGIGAILLDFLNPVQSFNDLVHAVGSPAVDLLQAGSTRSPIPSAIAALQWDRQRRLTSTT